VVVTDPQSHPSDCSSPLTDPALHDGADLVIDRGMTGRETSVEPRLA
jgi:hypothetical protein